MRYVNLQLQDDDPSCQSLPELLGTLIMVGSNHEATSSVVVESGDDSGVCYNLRIGSDDVASLWPELKKTITIRAPLDVRVIVTCQGEDGWNDYLLLYHFDHSEAIDTLS